MTIALGVVAALIGVAAMVQVAVDPGATGSEREHGHTAGDDYARLPLLTVAASQHIASGLPTRRMWWRVRANTGSGIPGTWSQIRRFELKS